MKGFSIGHAATMAWLRDLAIAVAIALLAGGAIAGATRLSSSPTASRLPAATASTPALPALDCRRLGTVGADGATAWAVAHAVAPAGRGAEALSMMQNEAGNSLDRVVPGQALNVPVPC